MTKRFKPTRLNNSGRTVRQAAKVLRDRKWTRKTVGSPNGGMCAIGASSFAVTGRTELTTAANLIEQHPKKNELNKRLLIANMAVVDFGSWLKENGYSISGYVPAWNDEYAVDKEEVIKLMEKFADETDPQQP